MKLTLANMPLQSVGILSRGDIVVLKDPTFGVQGHMIINGNNGFYHILNLDTNNLWIDKFDSIPRIADDINKQLKNKDVELVKVIKSNQAELREIV